MIAAFLESVKYVGHMWPIAFVRIILGYQAISTVVDRFQKGYLEHAYISERLNLGNGTDGGLYFEVLKSLIQSQWLVMTYVFLLLQLAVGLSYVLGFGVRLASVFGMILSLHLYLFFDFPTSPGQIYMFYVHLLFCLVGAGRCLGLDYYFYKSRRGLLW